MSLSRLRARLDRLVPRSELGKDRDHDRRRRHDLQYRRLAPEGLTKGEEGELARLDAMFAQEDQDHNRYMELLLKNFSAEHGRGEPLSEAEKREFADLEKRRPPREEWQVAISRRLSAALERFERSNATTGRN